MRVSECLTSINFMRYIIGFFGIISIIITAYFYFSNYDNINCGNLKIGIILGLTSIFSLVLSSIMYCSSCISKIFVPISSLFILCTFTYNIYLYENIIAHCKQHYIDKNIWPYYCYLVISLGIITIISFIFMICVIHRKKKERSYYVTI
jgi:hypothetical protein